MWVNSNCLWLCKCYSDKICCRKLFLSLGQSFPPGLIITWLWLCQGLRICLEILAYLFQIHLHWSLPLVILKCLFSQSRHSYSTLSLVQNDFSLHHISFLSGLCLMGFLPSSFVSLVCQGFYFLDVSFSHV